MKNRYTPIQAIHKYCVIWCCADQFKEVELCPVDDCPLHIYRLGEKKMEENTSQDIWDCGSSGFKRFVAKTELTSLKAIKYKCLDCSAGYREEINKCWKKDCFLYPFRKGHNPARRGLGRLVGNGKEFKKTPTHDASRDETRVRHSTRHTENGLKKKPSELRVQKNLVGCGEGVDGDGRG